LWPHTLKKHKCLCTDLKHNILMWPLPHKPHVAFSFQCSHAKQWCTSTVQMTACDGLCLLFIWPTSFMKYRFLTSAVCTDMQTRVVRWELMSSLREPKISTRIHRGLVCLCGEDSRADFDLRNNVI
jgi:hypothetical protein